MVEEWTAPKIDPKRAIRELADAPQQAAAMRAIARRHGFEHEPCAPFASGSDIVWGVGEQHVVKLTVPRWKAQIETEARHLRLVHERLSVRTPCPVALGELDGWPYVVTTRVAGRSIGSVWPDLEPAERARLACDLGALVGELHGVEPGPADEWEPFWEGCTRAVVARHAAAPPELVGASEALLGSLFPLDDRGRAFLHTEVLHEHVLLEERAGRFELAALLDFADSRLGPPDYEFSAPVEFLFRGEPGLFPRFLDGYAACTGERPCEDPRLRLAWALCHRFGSLERMRLAAPRPVASLEELAQVLYR